MAAEQERYCVIEDGEGQFLLCARDRKADGQNYFRRVYASMAADPNYMPLPLPEYLRLLPSLDALNFCEPVIEQ